MSNKYRQVQVSFWQDAFVLDLTPEEKYFYVYLMTNSKASQIGIYELPMRIIEMETGYNRETVEKLIQRFKEYEKIDYHEPTREIILFNWAKHNWNNSPKVVSRVEKELADIKHIPFAEKYLSIVESIKSDNVSIQYQYPINEVKKKESAPEIPSIDDENDAESEVFTDFEKIPENVDTTTFDTVSIPYQYSMHTKDKDKDKDKENKEYVGEIEIDPQEESKTKSRGRKQVYDKSSIHFQLASRLYQRILENNENHKMPNLQNWANDVRLMMERDNRTEEQIVYLIDWCQNDNFWMKNVLSIAKLRERFDQLVMQVKSERKKSGVTKPPSYEEVKPSERNCESNESDTSELGDVQLFR